MESHLRVQGDQRSLVRIVIPVIIGIIIVSIIAVSSVRIVDAGNRGILVQFGNVATDNSLDEGIHFVIPFRDNVVQMEVRTQKIVESADFCIKRLARRKYPSSFKLSRKS